MRAYKATDTGRLIFYKSTESAYWVEPYNGLQVPCGTCILCREEQARQTAIRIYHEASVWEESSFLTLTYNNENLPTHGSLDYSHLVKFWKRLRKRIGKLRYYAVGEYGDKTFRPHYHACIFGHAFTEGRVIVKDYPHLEWHQQALTDAWGMGEVRIGSLTIESARYTASYVTKKLRSKQQYKRTDEETGELIPVVQPRAFMSKNLGKTWWDRYGHQVADHDHVVVNGQPQKPPKAYDRWLSEVDEKRMQEIKEKRREEAKPQSKEENRARARNAHARAQRKRKSV